MATPLRAALAASMLLPCAALAQAGGWYAGLAAGQSRTADELVQNRESTITLASDMHSDFDATGSAGKLFGGYRFNPYLALEASYADLGRDTLATRFLGGDPAQPSAIRTTRKVAGFGADLLVGAPLGARALLFARLGAFRSRLEASAELSGNVVFNPGNPDERARSTTRNETVAHYGIGGEWALTRDVALRLEWERYAKVGKAFEIGGIGTTGEADMDAWFAGVALRFR
jgi:OmpA-OmpF porin, OOP family